MKIRKRMLAYLLAAAVAMQGMAFLPVHAEEDVEIVSGEEVVTEKDLNFQGENPVSDDTLTQVDENGNVTIVKVEDGSVDEAAMFSRAAGPMIVNFNTKGSSRTTNYTEDVTGEAGYTCGAYGADAAYLGTSGTKVKFMQAGVIGLVEAKEVQIIPKANAKSMSHFEVSSGRLYHKIATNLNSQTAGSTLDSGPAPSYLKAGVDYYSYDGHYFYTEDHFGTMLDDYNKKVRSHAVNPNNPYYNYFQYLPFRSVSNYSADSMNAMINNRVQADSKMKNTGKDFVNYQNTYGVNALLMTGIGANESAWGMSTIAKNKNNLFGLNAVDSSPGQSANYFASVGQCIKEFADTWLSKGYLDPSDSRYYGGFLGNKASGINRKYASDPYWGEKAAAIVWSIDKANGNKDAYKYTIGIKDTIGPVDYRVNIRNGSSTSSVKLYQTRRQGNCAYLVLNSTPVNKFYQIQSDGVLNSARTKLDTSTGVYHFKNMYAYISSDYLTIVHKGNTSQPAPTPTPTPPQPTPTPPKPAPKKAQVNYSTHVQNVGWQKAVSNGAAAGTTGQKLRLEAIKISLSNQEYTGGIQYSTHVQNIGWQDWRSNGAVSGTEKKSLRLEGIKIQLTGQMAQKYDVYYRVHAQNYGWLGWAKNGAAAGTEGFGYRLEAIEIRLVAKGGKAPGTTQRPFVKKTLVNYSTHIQNIGWQSGKADGELSGTTGKALRLEAIKISLGNVEYTGGIQYSTHIQNIGWQNWKSNGVISGTEKQAKRLEAIKIKLTGTMASKYDVYYRVHAQNYGWLNWTKNGNPAGTQGKAKRLEAVEIRLVKKGSKGPAASGKAFIM